MWKQNLSPSKTPYYLYSARRKQQLMKYSKYKLLIHLLAKATNRTLKQSLEHFQTIIRNQSKKLKRMQHLIQLNFNSVKILSFQKLKQNINVSRLKQRSLKNIAILLGRKEKYILKDIIGIIGLYSQRKHNAMILNIQQMRKIIFCRKIQNIFKTAKNNYFHKMVQYSTFKKKMFKKVRTAGIISKQYLKNVKQACFNRINKFSSTKLINTGKSKPIQSQQPFSHRAPLQSQNRSLQIQIQDMTVQLQNKNQSISRLEQQIHQLKMQQPSNHYNSFSEYTTLLSNPNNRNKTKILKKMNQNDSIDSGGIGDFSIGSILGTSFTTLNKSRSRSIKNGGSLASFDCNCGYREKYMKYKNSNESLKNQLQIVKEELQVAKDLNDHFTNQIRQYFSGEKNQIELDRLRKQAKDLQRQRDQLRMKVTKYQHHISTLKSEFKIKIEQLYRKVKKQR